MLYGDSPFPCAGELLPEAGHEGDGRCHRENVCGVLHQSAKRLTPLCTFTIQFGFVPYFAEHR